MVLGNHGRGFTQTLFGPLARRLVRAGVSPNTVTVIGTLLLVVAALSLFPTGHLAIGALVIGAVVLCDSIDGIMARESGHSTRFGSFLDSTLDRVADGAIFIGLTLYFVRFESGAWQLAGLTAAVACLTLSVLVSYARAKAESLQMTASVGIAERADRLIVTLVAVLAVGLGAPVWVLVGGLGLLGVASAITIGQRIATVYAQDTST